MTKLTHFGAGLAVGITLMLGLDYGYNVGLDRAKTVIDSSVRQAINAPPPAPPPL